MNKPWTRYALAGALLLAAQAAWAQAPAVTPNLPEPTEPLDIRMSTLPYPAPVAYRDLSIEGKKLQMAYMDVKPDGAGNGQAIVLLHGGLGFGATFKNTIPVLTKAGYRVVVPDQLGFGKSSKDVVRYSFQLWAKNTRELLQSLGIEKSVLLGHSQGGMLAMRYTLMYPEAVTKLVLENPLGLEDYRLVIPFKTVDELTAVYAKATWAGIQGLQASTYAKWGEAYADNAYAFFRVTKDPNYPLMAQAMATNQSVMLYGDPVLYELKDIKARTLITWGEKDRTTPGKGYAKPEVRPTLGDFSKLAPAAAAQMPNAEVVKLMGVAHVPHVEDPDTFHRVVLDFLAKP